MIIGDGKVQDREYYPDCLERYRVTTGTDARGYVLDAPSGLESKLDGKFWR